jgi:dienelactone hydrolase
LIASPISKDSTMLKIPSPFLLKFPMIAAVLPMLLAGLWATPAPAKETPIPRVSYTQDTTALEGRWVYPATSATRLPLVVLFPDWMGVSPTATEDAARIASWGYAVFVADPYGVHAQPKRMEEAAAQAGALKRDIPLLRARAIAALETAKRQTSADTTRVVAVGYCFGGTTALELARSGASLAGAVSIHGNLKSRNPDEARSIRGSVLVLHGANDPFVPQEEVTAFQNEMKTAGADWELVQFGGAVHAFTNARAGNDPSRGAAYHPVASERAYHTLRNFLQEKLGPEPKSDKRKK